MENKGKYYWEFQLYSGREREGGKSKQCEVVLLKSVKN